MLWNLSPKYIVPDTKEPPGVEGVSPGYKGSGVGGSGVGRGSGVGGAGSGFGVSPNGSLKGVSLSKSDWDYCLGM